MSTTASFTLPAVVPDFVPPPDNAQAPDGTYAHYPYHVAQAQANLIEWFRKPRNLAVMLAAGSQAQSCEDAAWQLYNAFDLETATGATLDMMGALVGENRSGRTDEDFRAGVRARILVNRSDGTIEDILAVAMALLPNNTGLRLVESYPASFRLEIYDTFTDASVATVARMIRQAKPAGVGFLGVAVDPTDTMIWGEPTRGWGHDWARTF